MLERKRKLDCANSGIAAAVGGFFKSIISSVGDFFKKLFS